MKKLNVLVAGMAIATLASCGSAGTGKVQMKDVKDTISYSIGMGRAVRVYKDNLPYEIVDSATMKSFLKGFMDAASNPDDKSKMAYSIGFQVGSEEMGQAFTSLSSHLFGEGETFNKNNYLSGFLDGMNGKWDIMTFEEADEISNRLYEVLSNRVYDKVRLEGQAFLEKKAQEEDVFKTPSGLLYQVISLGAGGAKPTKESRVEVRYRGTFIDGKVFDESKEPVSFNVNGVIAGWSEGVQLMSPGDKYRFFIPYDLAYGERGQGDIPPFSALIFEVELISVK